MKRRRKGRAHEERRECEVRQKRRKIPVLENPGEARDRKEHKDFQEPFFCRKGRTVTADCEKVFVTPKCQKIVKTNIQFWLDVKSNLTAPRGLDFIWGIHITYRT